MIDNALHEKVTSFIRGEKELSTATVRELMQQVYGEAVKSTMSMRDQFACAALVHAMTSEDGEQAARDAYKIADCMLKVRGTV